MECLLTFHIIIKYVQSRLKCDVTATILYTLGLHDDSPHTSIGLFYALTTAREYCVDRLAMMLHP